MHIDLNNLEETKIVGFKGGHGEMIMRAFVDDKCRIMRNVLKPGAASGLHKHEENCEVVFVLSGEGTFYCDGEKETLLPGQVHYCPMGHAHYFENNGTEDFVFFAIVPEHH